MILQSLIDLLIKTNDSTENHKLVKSKWKGVILGRKHIFLLACSKYLSSWTGLGKSGHVRFPTFGQISHVSGPKMVF